MVTQPVIRFKKRGLLIIVGLIIGLVPIVGHAQPATHQQRVEVKRVLQRNHVNGLALVNGTGDQPRVINNRETNNADQLVKANRLIPIASFQKAMTGVAIEKLILDGKLTLGALLSQFYPAVPNGSQITVERLMMHTSGLRNRPESKSPVLKTEQAQLASVLRHYRSTGDFTWHYSDIDFSFLAGIIHLASGEAYRTYLTKRVLSPLGVRVKFAGQLKDSRTVTQAVHHHQSWTQLQRLMGNELGAGDILCTPNDYWRFLERGILSNQAMLSQFTTRQNPNGETYFGGIYLESPYLHANGYLSGYSCTFYSDWTTHQTIMLFANNLSYHQLRAINSQLVHAYFGRYQEEQKEINAEWHWSPFAVFLMKRL